MADGAQPGAEGNVTAHKLDADFVPGKIGEVTGFRATAELVGSEIKVTVSAQTVYGTLDRKTTVTLDLKKEDHPEMQQIADLLMTLLSRAEPRLTRRLQRDAVMAMAGAVKLGEEIEEED